MSNPKGTRFATSLLPLLIEYYGEDTDRAPLHGTVDTGDFILPGERRFVLEAKCRKGLSLAEWVDEADTEAFNAYTKWALRGYHGKPPVGVVVHKRRGTTDPANQYVTLTLGGFLRLVHGK